MPSPPPAARARRGASLPWTASSRPLHLRSRRGAASSVSKGISSRAAVGVSLLREISSSIGGVIRMLWANRFDAPPNARPQPSSHHECVGVAEFIGSAILPTRQAAGGAQRPVASLRVIVPSCEFNAPGPSLRKRYVPPGRMSQIHRAMPRLFGTLVSQIPTPAGSTAFAGGIRTTASAWVSTPRV